MMKVQILTAPGCVHCVEAKKRVEKVVREAIKNLDIQIEMVDITRNPSIAIENGILSVPAIFIDGKLVFRGVPTEKELRRRIITK